MYKRHKSSILKHIDFMIIDLVILAIVYAFFCLVRYNFAVPDYRVTIFVKSGIVLLVLYLLVSVIGNNYKSILQRNKWTELAKVFIQVLITFLAFILYNYLTKETEFSRIILGMTAVVSFVLIWVVRVLWKHAIRMNLKKTNRLPKLLIITNSEFANEYVSSVKRKQYNNYRVEGVIISDRDAKGEIIDEIEVVENFSNIEKYMLSNIVDEIFVALDDDKLEKKIVDYGLELGVTVHISVAAGAKELPNAFIEKLGNTMVLTTSNNMADGWKFFVKRLMDIIGGFFGCIIMLIIAIYVVPKIKKADPGPAFFAQTRVGRNGRKFKLYKFRSMYMDAEERKKELMAQNQVSGHMFKMENDPRILPGIGEKIRQSSLDEWPQFFNILKGDMSLVGTRPPTVEEYDQYEAHHKRRLSFRPGLTGLWQVSGRNRINDFEKVVALDTSYIQHWSLKSDIKILLKTVKVVSERKGAM